MEYNRRTLPTFSISGGAKRSPLNAVVGWLPARRQDVDQWAFFSSGLFSIGKASRSFRPASISRTFGSMRLAGLHDGGNERGGYSSKVATNLKTSSIMAAATIGGSSTFGRRRAWEGSGVCRAIQHTRRP